MRNGLKTAIRKKTILSHESQPSEELRLTNCESDSHDLARNGSIQPIMNLNLVRNHPNGLKVIRKKMVYDPQISDDFSDSHKEWFQSNNL